MTALEQLFSDYYKDVYRYMFSLCRDASLSEDLTSEVFLEVVKSIASFRADSDVKTWLFSIARHRWFRYLEKATPHDFANRKRLYAIRRITV